MPDIIDKYIKDFDSIIILCNNYKLNTQGADSACPESAPCEVPKALCVRYDYMLREAYMKFKSRRMYGTTLTLRPETAIKYRPEKQIAFFKKNIMNFFYENDLNIRHLFVFEDHINGNKHAHGFLLCSSKTEKHFSKYMREMCGRVETINYITLDTPYHKNGKVYSFQRYYKYLFDNPDKEYPKEIFHNLKCG